jgi:hypothetical protein
MKSGFKLFTITEASNAKHALYFFQYEKNEHFDIAKKIRNDLEIAWSKISLSYEPIENDEESKYFNKIEFTNKKCYVGRFSKKNEVYPSVRIGNAFDNNVREECKKKLMSIAKDILLKYSDKLNKTLNGAPFSVNQEDNHFDEIRLRFKIAEFTKTIFIIGIEPGYKFERIYLHDYLSK